MTEDNLINVFAAFEILLSETPRWRNAAQWARNTMVKEGLLASYSPWGIWEITEAGRLFLMRNMKN